MRRTLNSMFVLAAFVLLAGCDPNPSADQAQAHLKRHRSTVDRLRTTLVERIEARPAVMKKACASTDPSCQGPTFEEKQAAVSGLRKEMLDIFQNPHILGLETRVDGPPNQAPLIDLGLTPGGHAHGRVPAAEGPQVGDFRLGRGAYQTSFDSGAIKAGDGEQRAGIEVRWKDEAADTSLTATLFVLGEDQTTPEWRKAIRRRHE